MDSLLASLNAAGPTTLERIQKEQDATMLETDQLQNTTNLPNEPSTSNDLTRRQLEAIRDEWLRPLLMQLRHQSEEVGRLQMQVQHLQHERDELIADLDASHTESAAATDPQSETDASPPESLSTKETLLGFLTQMSTTEGAAVTRIAIALGLWIGVGLLAFVAVG